CSTIFVPLSVSGQFQGWMNLCSPEIEFFTAEEVNVLDEMALDISHAMEFNQQEIERKQVELSLRLSEERYRSTLDNMMEGAQIIDFNWHYLYVNTAAATYGRLSREDLIGHSVMERYPGFENTAMYAVLEACLTRRISALDEFEFVYPDGEIAWFEFSIQPVPEGIFILSLDITQRKIAEQNIQYRLNELEAIQSISAAMRMTQTLPEVLPIFMQKTLTLVEADTGILWLYHADGNFLKSVSVFVDGNDISERDFLIKPGQGITGVVFQTGQSEFLDDLVGDPRTIVLPGIKYKPGSGGAFVPIRTDRELVGVLFIVIPMPGKLDSQRRSLLCSLADMAGNTIHRMKLHDETIRHLERLKSLHIIDLAISSNINTPETMMVLVEQTIQQLSVDAADIMLYNYQNEHLDYMSGLGFKTEMRHKIHAFSERGISSYTSLENLIIQSVEQSDLDGKTPFGEAMIAEGFKSYYLAPLMAKSKYLGILEVFSRSKLNPDVEWFEFLEALAGQAAIALDNSNLFTSLQQAHYDLSQAYDETIEGWSHALDLRDKETEGHTQRVTEITLKLAQLFEFNEDDLVHIRRGCLLHDIGKMGVPDYILLKPGALTDEEWVVMRKHPVYAYEMITPIDYLKPAVDIPYCHHEKWDGSGYPQGLKEEEIPLSARIFAIVDVWDALTSERPYRPAWSKEKTIEYIRGLSGKQFDPEVVRVFTWFMENWGSSFDI
ncbi:MAG: GAF domain-containing protein, partial [Anaerolineae bacterium]|nr:GAF domain-containing protein [Anaerolineae bacterium]